MNPLHRPLYIQLQLFPRPLSRGDSPLSTRPDVSICLFAYYSSNNLLFGGLYHNGDLVTQPSIKKIVFIIVNN